MAGNVLVGPGATLALGCTPGSIGPFPPCGFVTTSDTVGGSVIADHPRTMYLDGDTIHGSVISTGGGAAVTFSPYVSFPIKDDVIFGNLTVSGWHGSWFGVIRTTVHRNVVLTGNVTADPDSTEVVTNIITGNLVCLGNSPAAQIGDSGGTPNTVGGQKIGECAGL